MDIDAAAAASVPIPPPPDAFVGAWNDPLFLGYLQNHRNNPNPGVHPWQRKRGRKDNGGSILATKKRDQVAKDLLRHHPKTLLRNIPPPMLQFQDNRTTDS